MKIRNRPEPAGYALGEHLARFADEAAVKLRAEGVVVPECCSTCAFRKGAYANGCVTTVMDATKCMIEHVPFMCHHDKAEKTPCAGFLAVMADKGPDDQPGSAPWPFSDEVGDPSPPPAQARDDRDDVGPGTGGRER